MFFHAFSFAIRKSSHTEWLKPNQCQSQTENPFEKAFSFLRENARFPGSTEERTSTFGREERTTADCGADLGSHSGDAGRPLHRRADRGRNRTFSTMIRSFWALFPLTQAPGQENRA